MLTQGQLVTVKGFPGYVLQGSYGYYVGFNIIELNQHHYKVCDELTKIFRVIELKDFVRNNHLEYLFSSTFLHGNFPEVSSLGNLEILINFMNTYQEMEPVSIF